LKNTCDPDDLRSIKPTASKSASRSSNVQFLRVLLTLARRRSTRLEPLNQRPYDTACSIRKQQALFSLAGAKAPQNGCPLERARIPRPAVQRKARYGRDFSTALVCTMTLYTRAQALAGVLAGTLVASVRPARADEPSTVPANASLGTLLRARTWINGTPTRESLRGQVVLVDVFTFDCINCKNITPNLRTLARTKRDGLTIVGIHSPETPYERDHAQVVRHLGLLGVTWPVAVDNDFALWKAYGIEYWPTQMIFDRRGKLRKVVEGDSQDVAVDAAVNALLRESA
jgi:thiol-disulfide isomerase/thioredoxin